MELKKYQQDVITDLSLFLDQVQETKDVRNAFHNFLGTPSKNSIATIPRKSN